MVLVSSISNYSRFTMHAMAKYVYIYIYIYYCYRYCKWLIPGIPSMNLDEVLTYNQMALMSLRNRGPVKVSMVSTRAVHLCIHNYIGSLLNIIAIHILLARMRIEPVSAYPTRPHTKL